MSTLDPSRYMFEQTAAAFVQLVDQIPLADYEKSALGTWNVRELIGHAGRAMTTVLTYIDQPADTISVHSPAAYFHATKRMMSPDAVAARGVEAGKALVDGASEAIHSLYDQVVQKLDAIDLDSDPVVSTPAGGMLLSTYLHTRILELSIHSVDLTVATGIRVDLPADAFRVTLETLADLAVFEGSSAKVLLALSGRKSLPENFSVLG